MVTIVDYGVGNVQAFANVYKRLNVQAKRARTAEQLQGATHIILPGVGAFDYAMSRLNQSGMREELDNLVTVKNVPVLGICVGMQLLGARSDEGDEPGLGWIDGEVKLFDHSLIPFRTHLPHMGWNNVRRMGDSDLLAGFDDESRFYFLHSYYFACRNGDDIIATTEYGSTFASAIHHGNVYGTQFHPEKSHANGVRLLSTFASL